MYMDDFTNLPERGVSERGIDPPLDDNLQEI